MLNIHCSVPAAGVGCRLSTVNIYSIRIYCLLFSIVGHPSSFNPAMVGVLLNARVHAMAVSKCYALTHDVFVSHDVK